jgi:hypothetical protein
MPHTPPARRTVTVLAAAALLAGCAQEVGGVFVGSSLEVPDCRRLGELYRIEPFEMALRHVAVHHEDTGATIRLSGSAAELWRIDQLVFTIPSALTPLDAAATPGPLRLVLDAAREGSPGQSRLNILLMDTCSNRSAALVGRGVVELDAWGSEDGDRVTGRIAVDVVDPRSDVVRGVGFTGEFDLVVDRGSPFNAFAPREF